MDEEGEAMTEECNCDQALELKQAIEEIRPLVQEVLRLGTKEGRENYVLLGAMGAARMLQIAQTIIDNSAFWTEDLVMDEGTPIETVDRALRQIGIDPEKITVNAHTLKTSIKMAGAARAGLVRSMMLAMNEACVSDERAFREFALALAKREGVKVRVANPNGPRPHLEVETDEGWES